MLDFITVTSKATIKIFFILVIMVYSIRCIVHWDNSPRL